MAHRLDLVLDCTHGNLLGLSPHAVYEAALPECSHLGHGGIESECIRNGFVVSPSLTRFGHSSFAGCRLLFRKINRLREGLILKRVVKRHLLGARIRENAAKTRGEDVVQTIIGPESEDTTGAQMCGKSGEPLLAVESGVLRIEHKVGGMIDVHEHCVKSAGRDGRIKARFGRREREEIALNEAAPEVAGQLGAERHQPFRMPFDHSFQRLDDKKRGDFVVL
jgi:hypothetical protein